MPSSMSCRECLRLLRMLPLDALPGELEAHAQGCPECAAELRLMSRVGADLRALPAPASPPQLRNRVRRALQEEAAPTRTVSRQRSGWWWMMSAGATLGAAALLALTLGRGQHMGDYVPSASRSVSEPMPAQDASGGSSAPVRRVVPSGSENSHADRANGSNASTNAKVSTNPTPSGRRFSAMPPVPAPQSAAPRQAPEHPDAPLGPPPVPAPPAPSGSGEARSNLFFDHRQARPESHRDLSTRVAPRAAPSRPSMPTRNNQRGSALEEREDPNRTNRATTLESRAQAQTQLGVPPPVVPQDGGVEGEAHTSNPAAVAQPSMPPGAPLRRDAPHQERLFMASLRVLSEAAPRSPGVLGPRALAGNSGGRGGFGAGAAPSAPAESNAESSAQGFAAAPAPVPETSPPMAAPPPVAAPVSPGVGALAESTSRAARNGSSAADQSPANQSTSDSAAPATANGGPGESMDQTQSFQAGPNSNGAVGERGRSQVPNSRMRVVPPAVGRAALQPNGLLREVRALLRVVPQRNFAAAVVDIALPEGIEMVEPIAAGGSITLRRGPLQRGQAVEFRLRLRVQPDASRTLRLTVRDLTGGMEQTPVVESQSFDIE